MGKKSKSSVAATTPQKDKGGWKGKAYGLAEKFEQIVNAAAAPLPSGRIRLWLAGFFHPEETYEKVENDATLVGLAGNLLLFYIAYSLIFFLFMLAFTSILSAEDLLAMGLQKSPDVAQIAIGSLVVSPIVSTLMALVAFAAVFVPSRILGGKGTYVKQANSMALVLCGSNTLLLALMCIAFAIFTPSFILRDSVFAGTVASLAAVIVSLPVLLICIAVLLYSVYAYYLVAKKAHGLSAMKASGAMAIAVVLILALDAVANIVFRN
ncbi:MAG: YIP1 family protein [Candidatus Micrarchaeia archaeon]